MDDIRNVLLKGSGNKLTKKQYKFAVELEKSRLLQQLIFLTFVSLLIAVILFFSLYFDIRNMHSANSSDGIEAIVSPDVVTPIEPVSQ